MKKRILIIIITITLLLELSITYIFKNNIEITENDPVKINELTHELKNNYNNISKYPKTLDYTIINDEGNVLYQTNDNTSKTLSEAYRNNDTIVDLEIDGKLNKILINNNINKKIQENNNIYIKIIIGISIIQILSFIVYYIVLHINIIKPFKKMKEFSNRITAGDLEIPLEMDKNNNFGAFTEAFDIMRDEIKKSRTEEKKAISAKKELVAKLSHDIKTPIASIKSYSELGLISEDDSKKKKYFKSINQKTDFINNMINNLFNATLEEMEELNINPEKTKSTIISELLENSDYLKRCNTYDIKECRVYIDKLRLQQVLDNIIINSYKYANTDIEIKSEIKDSYLKISIKDFGDTIKEEEIPLLTEKYKRGKNINNQDGSGLGLYICKQLIEKMNGEICIENCNPGFKVILKLRII